uniref:Na(+)/H(+) exchange regulatory cofactor NHE-RF1 n=1 Tax=Athene cunicularia TaxID=194338 RepID=A0A663LSS5_ATHCN
MGSWGGWVRGRGCPSRVPQLRVLADPQVGVKLGADELGVAVLCYPGRAGFSVLKLQRVVPGHWVASASGLLPLDPSCLPKPRVPLPSCVHRVFWHPVSQLKVSVGAVGHLRMLSLPPKQPFGDPGAVPGCQGGVWEQCSHRLSLLQEELRPRLCRMKKGPNGYGFNLHSDKSRPGQYVRAVDPDSPAEAAGLAPQDRIIEVNGVCMEGKQHADVVAAIKAGGDETRLLVVDILTDEFFKKCRVVPSEEHLAGGLGTVLQGENGGELRSSSVSESPSSPGLLAVSPDSGETHSEVDTQEGDKRHSAPGSLLDLDIPLAVAKERAHQKRTSKRAPQMDWSKKNELFSNL